MKPVFYLLFLLPILIVLIHTKKKKNWVTLYLKRKYGKEDKRMREAAEKMIGKDCLIYLLSGEQVTGIVREVTGHSMLIESSGTREFLNLDFVVRIREYPKTKKGKKKAIVLD